MSRADGDRVGGDLVPRRTTLDGFAREAADSEGFDVRTATPLTPIVITTRNSRYRITPLRWGSAHVLVQGGRFFAEPTEARLVGSTFGGSFLEVHCIRVGMCMEIDPGPGLAPIITTRVLNVAIEHDAPTHARPH